MRQMIEPREALDIILEHTPGPWGFSSPDDALSGLAVTREPVSADRDIPEADVSRMDGYAVVAPVEAGAELRRIGEIPAGSLPDRALAEGECVRIYTGSVLPPEANAVVKQEDVTTSPDGEVVRPSCRVEPGENVAARGSIAKQGAVLLPAGSPLGAAQQAVCAAVGARPECCAVPLLGVLRTGEEVVPEDGEPGPHQTRDANSPAIMAAAMSAGAVLYLAREAPDDLTQLTDELRMMVEDEDLDALVTIGAVSVGDYDLVPEALEAVGAKVLLHGIACKPGKPFLFAVADNAKPIFGVPGNPVSALVTFFEFVAPALRKMAGRPEPWAPTLPVRLAAEVAGVPGATYYELARVTQDADGSWVAEPMPSRHSGDVAAAARADGVVIVPPGDAGLPAGANAQFRPWRQLW
jgi:molybdopterin molybdotransferase